MTETAATGALDDLGPVIAALPPDAVLFLERLPQTWLDRAGRRAALHVGSLADAVLAEGPSRGRLFCEAYELRWEPVDQRTLAVYVGSDLALPGLQTADIDLSRSRETAYDLWGERLADPMLVGELAGATVYVELRIPRLLRYPVSAMARRVRVRVREYLDDAGALLLYRFFGLEEVS